MRHVGWSAVAAAGLCLCAQARGQGWTVEELDSRTQGFLKDGVLDRFEQIGRLVAAQDQAAPVIAARIHGDHREYLLKIQRLIDQLSDERWVERERAERDLIDVGSRAGELLRQHRDHPRLHEEAIRCKRILEALEARGTEKEEAETRRLRGLTATALYLRADEALTRALLSALGHTDPEVVVNAVRALGVHGHGESAKAVRGLLDGTRQRRRAVLASLARMPGEESLRACRELMLGTALDLSEKMGLLRGLRARPDAVALLGELGAHPEPLVAAGAGLALPTPDRPPIEVEVTLSDRTKTKQPFLGLGADVVRIGSPVGGLDRLEVPYEQCEALDFPHPAAPAGACRVFLTQGSLLTGRLIGMRGDDIALQTAVFGEVAIPRDSVQGIAMDPALDRLIGASTDSDRVRRRDQSLADGRIASLSEAEVVLQRADGSASRVPMAEVVGLLFRRPMQPPADDSVYTRLDLTSGDRILGHVVGAHPGAFAVVAPILGAAIIPVKDVTHVELEVSGGALWGFTLIADYSDNRIVEVDEQGRAVFVIEDVYGAWDAECLDNGNLLITEFAVSRVQEVTRKGETVWSFETDLRNPYDADRLRNGNTLIADTFRNRVIEVAPDKRIVWQYAEGIRPFDADRLANGNTLIADVLKDRVIEVDPYGKIAWEKNDLPSVHDADRLANGNTLITLRTLNRVIEVDGSGNEVWRLGSLHAPSDADRLPNGHTLVAENNMVREFDRGGNVVWQKEMTWAVEVNRY